MPLKLLPKWQFYNSARKRFKNMIGTMWINKRKKVQYGELDRTAPPPKQLIAD